MIRLLGRRFAVRVLAWAVPRIPAEQLQAGFSRAYRHRDEDWRREVWREAAERSARKAIRA